MFAIIQSVIMTGNYDLSSLLNKIDTMWIQSRISDEERGQLITLAREHTNNLSSINTAQKLAELDQRLHAIENEIVLLKNPVEAPVEEYPPYEQGKWYYAEDKITYEEQHYICTAPDGVVCVWSPSEYPSYWQLVEDITESV